MLQQALAACAKRSAELFQQKALIVDDELYGVIDLPRTMNLFRGRVIRFPGYGDVQVTSVSADTLRCSKTVDGALAESASAVYPLTVVPAALSRAKSKDDVTFDEPIPPTPTEFL
jgi:hypothetical protein